MELRSKTIFYLGRTEFGQFCELIW